MIKSKKANNEYGKYKWFLTSSDKLVIGGKNAEQNEELVKNYKDDKKFSKYVFMHTKTPGSPFSIILSDKYNEKDLGETAIFTGCFSRAWRERKKSVMVDVFLVEQIIKNKNMKTGTFGVVGKIDRKPVSLKLYLTKQNNKLRAVPFAKKDSVCIIPGKISKEKFAEQLSVKLDIPMEEILNALPTGGFQTC
ncbi:MAG: NFACT RNA binding domain-containing protein [Nanoarchaeota archaeon]